MTVTKEVLLPRGFAHGGLLHSICTPDTSTAYSRTGSDRCLTNRDIKLFSESSRSDRCADLTIGRWKFNLSTRFLALRLSATQPYNRLITTPTSTGTVGYQIRLEEQ